MNYELDNNSVLTLVNKLCRKLSGRKCGSGSSLSDHDTKFEKTLKKRFFEIILSKSEILTEQAEPIQELLTYYFIKNNNKKNVIEFENVKKLKEVIDHIMDSQKKDNTTLYEVLSLLIRLKDSVVSYNNQELYENPFTFGKMEEMLPRPCVEDFGSSCTYPYFPSYLFENLNQTLLHDKSIANNFLYNHTAFNENVNSNRINSANSLYIRELRGYSHCQGHIPFFSLPIAPAAGIDSSCNEGWIAIQKLSRPRDLLIPKSGGDDLHKKKISTYKLDGDNEGIQYEKQFKSSSTIWEIARTLDAVDTRHLWELAAKEPNVYERSSMAPQQVALWKEKYAGRLHHFTVTSERKFIRHLMYLAIGIESSCFYVNKSNVFVMRPGLALEGISSENLQSFVSNFLIVGTCYWRLNQFALGTVITDSHRTGFIYRVCENNVREFLVKFRVQVTSMFDGGQVNEPTLLQLVQHMRPLKQQIETIAAIHKVIDTDPEESFPHGAGLMAYLYKEISMVTHGKVAHILYAFLNSICRVYFKFIERFIFEGELEDPHHEFFIQKEPAFAHMLSKRYWDRGFYIRDRDLVPTFLKGLAKDILLCGKSLRLLKQCNPNDPLCVLLSSEHPALSCCTGFVEVAHQRRLLEVYRTRCRFVCGEPVTFDAIALRKEAERKAFTKKASIKQQETIEKIVEDRKRLARLIAEEKQNSLRFLEAALAADKLRKQRRGPRDLPGVAGEPCDLPDSEDAPHALHAHFKDQEQKKIMEYYSKLNEQVEIRKQHSDWKLKRLQLHESRVQMLSSEERHLRCQKLQLQHSTSHLENGADEHSAEIIRDGLDNHEVNHESLPTDVVMEYINDNGANNQPSKYIETNDKNSEKNNSINIFDVIFTAAKNIFSHEDSESVIDDTRVGSEKLTNKIIDINKNPVNENTLANCVNQAYLPDLNSNEYTQRVTATSLTADQEIQEQLNFQSRKVEALANKRKVLNEFATPADKANSNIQTWKPEAFDTNKQRNVGSSVDFTQNANTYKSKTPTTLAQQEAIHNKQKILLNEFNEPTQACVHIWKPEEFDTNKDRNEISSIGFVVGENEIVFKQKVAVTEAQGEAIQNKQRVLLNEFNTPVQIDIVHSHLKVEEFDTNKVRNEVSSVQFSPHQSETHSKLDEPVTDAQRQAIKNKKKVLGSEYGIRLENIAKENTRKHSLTLDLKTDPVGSGKVGWHNMDMAADLNVSSAFTPAIATPGHLSKLLDLETPTCDILIPPSPGEEILCSHVSLLNGFSFPGVIVEENIQALVEEHESMFQTEEEISVQSPTETEIRTCNLLKVEGYSFDDFDPFGVRGAAMHSKDHFSGRMLTMANNLLYGNGEEIVKTALSKPMWDIFNRACVAEEDASDGAIDLMTLRACLQRSVMLPLSYQLEMVNNSILTYFLHTLDMYEHLKSLKDYFFLMDGEFSRSICCCLFKKLTAVSKPDELLNFATLHNLLNRAFSSSISTCSKYSENVSFTVKELPVHFQHSSPDVLKCLALSYSVAWPMNIILSNEALERYSMVFQFLLKMKRILWILGQDFEMLKITYKSSNNLCIMVRSPQYRCVQLFRHSMASLIRALDSYLVTSCLLATWTEFEEALKRARTLDDLYDCHVAYVKQILFRCLLNKRSAPVMTLLNDIFTVILRFHQVLNARSWQVDPSTGSYCHPSFDNLKELSLLIDKLTRRLHKTVVRLMDCGYQPHLAQLITAINLNDFYNKPN